MIVTTLSAFVQCFCNSAAEIFRLSLECHLLDGVTRGDPPPPPLPSPVTLLGVREGKCPAKTPYTESANRQTVVDRGPQVDESALHTPLRVESSSWKVASQKLLFPPAALMAFLRPVKEVRPAVMGYCNRSIFCGTQFGSWLRQKEYDQRRNKRAVYRHRTR